MPLPPIIEIVPLPKPVHAQVTVPGSKSITNRALVLAALATGQTTLQGALWSEDTQVMLESLRKLGFDVNVSPDPHEACNRTITVSGQGGKIPRGGTLEKPLELFVGNAGTAARFLAALVCLGQGTCKISGVSRMHERPQAALFQALRNLSYRIDSPNDRLPAVIHGAGPRPGRCSVRIEESSQFASALLLCSKTAGWQVEVTGENAEEAPYVAMTLKLMDTFPQTGGAFQIEPDCSSGSYFLAAGSFELAGKDETHSENGKRHETVNFLATVKVANWPRSGWQIDEAFYEKGFCALEVRSIRLARDVYGLTDARISEILKAPSAEPNFVLSRRYDLGDSIMTAIVLAPLLLEPAGFTDLGRLRVQECERVQALGAELTKCGAKVSEKGNTLTVYPSPLHGAEIETYNDHRMAMSFSILGLKVPGIKIKNPGCVKKTFPNFFQKLAAPPPAGLGAVILNSANNQPLKMEDLFADDEWTK